MKKYLPLILLILIVVLHSCVFKSDDKRSLLKVFPLSPYTDTVKFDKDEDVGPERKNGIKIKYFIINESVDYTELTKDRITDFIRDSLQKDTKRYRAIYFTFYKKGHSLDKDYQQTAADPLANYLNNKFAEYEYINGKLFNFDFYKDGAYYEPPTTNEEASN